MSYKSLLTQGTEAKEAAQVEYQVSAKNLELQQDIIETKRALAAEQTNRTNMAASTGLSFSSLAAIDNKITDLTAGLALLEGYQTEFFPAEAATANA